MATLRVLPIALSVSPIPSHSRGWVLSLGEFRSIQEGMGSNRRSRWLGIVLAGFLLMAGTGCSNDNTGSQAIRIGSKDFAEQFILGELYAQALEAEGFSVERKLNLGGTPVAQAGLLAGEIDLYPEYTGTALLTVLKLPPESNREAVYTTVAREYRERFALVWLAPSPLSNSYALVTTKTVASQENLATISDLVARADRLVAAGPPIFQVREDGLPGLREAYGDFSFKDYKAVDPGLRYPALAAGEADVVVGFTTDGAIAARDLIVLQDDRHFFPPYQVAPVVREAILERHPDLAAALDRVTAKLTDEAMQRMNLAVTGKKQEPAAVARDFLQREGLSSAP